MFQFGRKPLCHESFCRTKKLSNIMEPIGVRQSQSDENGGVFSKKPHNFIPYQNHGPMGPASGKPSKAEKVFRNIYSFFSRAQASRD